MKAAPATGNEILLIGLFAAAIAFGIGYSLNPNAVWGEEEKVVVVQPVKVKKVVADMGPGWASGRWLGEGDFHYAEKMRHPFADQPRYAGHPFHMKDIDHAPPGPRLPMH